jgi:hypothetical protein
MEQPRSAAGGTMKKHVTPQFLRKGHLNRYFESLRKGQKPRKLENHDLTRIATILGHLARDYDLYNCLFESPNVELEVDGDLVNTKDLASFVLMDHTYTRGYFSKTAGKNATSDTTNCQGVPLALEGARRVFGKTYESWLDGVNLKDIDEMWKLDVFLPAQLGSLELGSEGLQFCDKYGLLVLRYNEIDFPPDIINYLRDEIGNWATAINPRVVKVNEEEMSKKLYYYLTTYNDCSHRMRSLILRGWVWNENVCNSDMITNIMNWDEAPKGILFDGMKPKVVEDPYLEFLR